MAGYADYAIDADAFDEGLGAALDAFKDAVAQAYIDCKDAGVADLSPEEATVDAHIAQLADDLTNAIHKFTLSAKIDTLVTFAGPAITAIPAAQQVVDATWFPGPDGILDAANGGAVGAESSDDEEGPAFGETITMMAVGGQLAAGTDPGPVDEQTGPGKGHLE